MRFTTGTFLLAGLLTTVSAHFQLQFPAPRGAFVEDQEPTFCGMDVPRLLVCVDLSDYRLFCI